MELVAGIAVGIAVGGISGLCFGFWAGFSFIKKQLPELPKPEVKVENHNHIDVVKSPVLQPRSPLDKQREGVAEFIGEL